jgi:hypothetical protein
MRGVKRPAVLLEVLIAISLLTIGAVLLVRQPILFYRAELDQLERVECDRIATWTYTEIRELLMKGTIRWSQIPPLGERSQPWTLPPAKLEIPTLLSRTAARRFWIETLREKQDAEGNVFRLLSLQIEIGSGLKKRMFTYRANVQKAQLVVEKINPDSKK